MTAWSRRDLPAIKACYGEPFLVMPSGQEPIDDSGRLEKFLQRVTAGDRYSFTYRSEEVKIAGAFAVERGKYVLSFLEEESGTIRTSSGSLMRTLEKGTDGNWRISAEIWNTMIVTSAE